VGLTLSRLREGEHSCSPKHFIPQSVLASRNAAVRNDCPSWVPAPGKGGRMADSATDQTRSPTTRSQVQALHF
jgi:hypothetical protein